MLRTYCLYCRRNDRWTCFTLHIFRTRVYTIVYYNWWIKYLFVDNWHKVVRRVSSRRLLCIFTTHVNSRVVVTIFLLEGQNVLTVYTTKTLTKLRLLGTIKFKFCKNIRNRRLFFTGGNSYKELTTIKVIVT